MSTGLSYLTRVLNGGIISKLRGWIRGENGPGVNATCAGGAFVAYPERNSGACLLSAWASVDCLSVCLFAAVLPDFAGKFDLQSRRKKNLRIQSCQGS